MIRQSFTDRALRNCFRNGDFDVEIFKEVDAIVSLAVERSKSGFNDSYVSLMHKRNGKSVHHPERLSDKLVLRKIASNLKNVTRAKQQNRDIIVSNLINLICEDYPYTIVRLDIKSFYESVNVESIIEIFHNDPTISRTTVDLLKSVFDFYSSKGFKGLPRGLSVSAVLGEYILSKYDDSISTDKNVFFHSRFVDDIIVLLNDNRDLRLFKKQYKLPNGLQYNNKKCTATLVSDVVSNKKKELFSEFEYLGYHFKASNHTNKDSSRKVSISISPKKINKFKTKIIKSFYSYYQQPDFELLEDRIKMITSNYAVFNREMDKNINTGIYFNYKYVNDFTCLECLDRFLKATILTSCRKYVGIPEELSDTKKRNLLKYSFSKGFQEKIYYKFSTTELYKIRGCWANG
ncbi:MAG: RNA-directed DNA polymerase [Fibrobacterales bacterium]